LADFARLLGVEMSDQEVGEAVESIAHEDSQSIDFNELCTALSI
jgi:Ca2+-binding EF-hand superfamily protein